MSARQNKKQRKGRNNPNTRERTVTTLTEDPNTPFILVPRPSEEPAGTLMSSPFSVASSSAGNAPSSAYQPPSNYEAYGYAEFAPQQPFFNQQVAGSTDLEKLETLKQIIKAGQHSNYRPIPNPAALAAQYLGTIPTSTLDSNQFVNPTDGQSVATAGSNPSSPVDQGRRPPRLQSKEWEHSAQRKPAAANGAQPTNNVLSDSSPIHSFPLTSSSSFSSHIQTNPAIQGYGGRFNQSNAPAAIDTSNLQGNTKINSAGPLSSGPKSNDIRMSNSPSTLTEGPGPSPRFDSSNSHPPSGNPVPVDQPSHGETTYGGPRGPSNTDKGSFDIKDDLRPRENSWSARDGPPDDRRRDLDRPPPSPRPALNGSGGGSDTRSNPGDRPFMPREPPPRDDRFYDRDRERERERDYRDRRDWDRDRRVPYDRFRGPPEAVRRPPPEQRHYEPDYSRRYDVKEEPISDARRLSDLRRPPSPIANDRLPGRPEDDRPPLSARLPPSSDLRAPVDVSRPPHPDSRASVPPPRAPSPDNRPVRGPSFDERHVKPALPEERRGAPLPPDVRAAAPPVRPADIPGASRLADTRERDVPLPSVDAPRPSIPLEERISRPSLQDRISQPDHLSQPPASRPEPGRPPSLEERLSAIPVSADSREQRGRIPDRNDRAPFRVAPPIDDRSSGPRPPPPSSVQDDRRQVDDRPGRYTRPLSPPGDRATYPPHPPPAVRDDRDPRAVNKGPPSPRTASRDYRAPRPLSRERSGAYRPEDRNYIPDERRPDAMDVDAPPRFNDSRSVPYNRPFSPPSATDLARDRARAAQFPPPSPTRPPPHEVPPYDDDRRYPPARDWTPSYQTSYTERRREWSASDEEYYKSRQWDRNTGPPPSASDRDRFEREQPPIARNNGWETRDERERRDFPPPRAPSPSRSYDGPPRSLGSRLTADSFNTPAASGGAPSDRAYPPLPPAREPPSSFNRVRQRSLSPARRPGVPIDDRPPNKRSREDGYPPSEYYPPPSSTSQNVRGEPGPPLRRQDNYPPLSRGSSPPPPSSGSSTYFDNRGPSSSAVPPPADREYPSREYSYDRPRSPGPPRGATYSRGGYSAPRDDRRYPPPPPSSSMLPPRRP